eukprot:Pompholyxophrys_sp_v1_NODE_214_length_1136_cov_21.164662.p1 type:complete len:281 gc:universal NODE_214_length_1136_cov_21.164662:899-57(-)
MQKCDFEKKEWITKFVSKNPLSFLREICCEFQKHFNFDVSTSTVFYCLKEAGFTKQVIERRAMEVSNDDISRFTIELNALGFCHDQLLFLDEMSCDNRSMLRNRGWFLRGKRPIVRDCFRRGTRISILAFLGVNGFVECFDTCGTFDRLLFFKCCQNLLDSGKVQSWPGKNSIWVMDNAAIHSDLFMIDYFRSRGIFIIFLPAYSPFFMPIEVVFGLVKRECRVLYKNIYGTEKIILQNVLAEFSQFNASKIFAHCGYSTTGVFDPNINFDLILKEADLS